MVEMVEEGRDRGRGTIDPPKCHWATILYLSGNLTTWAIALNTSMRMYQLEWMA